MASANERRLVLPLLYYSKVALHVDQMADESIIITATMSFHYSISFFRFILIFAQTTNFLYLFYSHLFCYFLSLHVMLCYVFLDM